MRTRINLKIKNIFRFELSLIIALLFSFLHGAGVIRGQIIDGISQLPLNQANIIVENSETGTSSDVNGEFVIQCSEEGYYSILFNATILIIHVHVFFCSRSLF